MNKTIHEMTERIMDYYADEDASQIGHTQCVAHYTQFIAESEGLDERTCFLLTLAAWFHDIGCPAARKEYGSSKPVYQQRKGQEITAQWLADCQELTAAEKEWVAQVVGSHHQWHSAGVLHFEPLYEADLIVNLFEGYYLKERTHIYYDHMMRTATGRRLFRRFFMGGE